MVLGRCLDKQIIRNRKKSWENLLHSKRTTKLLNCWTLTSKIYEKWLFYFSCSPCVFCCVTQITLICVPPCSNVRCSCHTSASGQMQTGRDNMMFCMGNAMKTKWLDKVKGFIQKNSITPFPLQELLFFYPEFWKSSVRFQVNYPFKKTSPQTFLGKST